MAKTQKPQKEKTPEDLATPDVHLSEDEPSDGYCYLHAPRHMERTDPQTFAALSLIRKHSELGKRIVDHAEKQEVSFLRKTWDDETRGYCRGNIVEASSKNTLAEDAGVIFPHELMHWLQPFLRVKPEWDFRTRLLLKLTKEAGAETCAVRVCHEMHMDGYSDPFNNVSKNDGTDFDAYSPLYRMYDDVKARSIATGSNEDDAVLDAGDAAFHGYFEQPRLVRSYGGDALLEYASINFGSHYPIPGFGTKSAKGQTELSKGEFLIRKAKLPLDDDVLFSRNKTLRQAFEYAETVHIYNFYDTHKTNLAVKRKLRALEADENPFLGVDLNEALKEYNAQKDDKDSKSFLGVVKDIAGISKEKPRQMSFDFG